MKIYKIWKICVYLMAFCFGGALIAPAQNSNDAGFGADPTGSIIDYITNAMHFQNEDYTFKTAKKL